MPPVGVVGDPNTLVSLNLFCLAAGAEGNLIYISKSALSLMMRTMMALSNAAEARHAPSSTDLHHNWTLKQPIKVDLNFWFIKL